MRNEQREIKLDGAKPVKNSGRGEQKGDAILPVGDKNSYDDFLIDYKHYENTFSISRTAWKKHSKDAWNSSHKTPLIKVVYDDAGIELAIIDWDVFLNLIEGYGVEF
jgi:hypothetical protein